MRCLTCKNGNMEPSTTTYFAQLKNCYVIIENVPCMKCEQCGEEFFTSSVLEKIDDILDRLEQIASKIFIMDYATSAA
ncbi:MAG: type II toxin-antitoxin system MqsA family antitoxin [Blautia wexlerae]